MTQTDFAPLPRQTDSAGQTRRTGVEIEFSDLGADQTARIATRTLGGTAEQVDDHAWTVRDTVIGKLDIYLDTALRHARQSPVKRLGLDLGKEVIPVEIVTEPLDLEGLAALDRLRDALRQAGGTGSRAGLAYGFGVHLNPALASRDAAGITRPLLAYALIEDWMRQAHPIDFSRKIMPFTDPFPTALVRAFCQAGIVEPKQAMDLYLDHTQSRNHGLDMLPVFAWLDEAYFAARMGEDHGISGRPAFHFRLPDCRLDEPGWSLAQEWQRWHLVERVAEDEDLLARLMQAWDDSHGSVTLRRSPWADRCGDILEEAGMVRTEQAA